MVMNSFTLSHTPGFELWINVHSSGDNLIAVMTPTSKIFKLYSTNDQMSFVIHDHVVDDINVAFHTLHWVHLAISVSAEAGES